MTRFPSIAIRARGESSETDTSPGRVRLINVTPISLIRRAFGIQGAQIAGAPRWSDSERFDVIATTSAPLPLNDLQRQPFLQLMLSERFQLEFHREKRKLNAYSLSTVKDGAKLAAYSGKGEYSMKVEPSPSGMILRSTKGSVSRLIEILARLTGRTVLDQTGLTGAYDFRLEWVPDEETDRAGPSLFTALREQPGLKLEPIKGPVNVIVIDRIERPSEN